MKNRLLFIIIIFLSAGIKAQTGDRPESIQRLMQAYPATIKSFNGSELLLIDGQIIKYKKTDQKPGKEDLNDISLDDIFKYPYLKGKVEDIPRNYDPGRMRNEELLKKMYGSTLAEVQKKLVTITWCPTLLNQKIRVTTVNGVDKQFIKVSEELDKYPELKKYLTGATTFNWRKIRGTNRLSTHSFGIAIDINIKYSNYWQWDCRCTSEEIILKYKNSIPQRIVDIFEKHGFIWGGKWYHYDTMHFEYRPELLL